MFIETRLRTQFAYRNAVVSSIYFRNAVVDSISLTADAKAPSHRPLCRTRGMRFLGPIRYRRVIQRSHIGVVPLRLVTKARDMYMFETTTSALDACGFLKRSIARHIIRQAVPVNFIVACACAIQCCAHSRSPSLIAKSPCLSWREATSRPRCLRTT